MANLRANNLTGTGGRNAIDGSVSFDGGSSLTVADNSGYEFGTGDFTIECWINASDLTHERHLPIIQKGNSATNNLYDWRLYFNNHGSGSSLLYFDIACSGVSIGTNSTSVFVEKDWNHVAVTRQSGAFKVFFNGILEDTDSTTANAIDDDYTEIKIGFNDLGSAADSYLKGYISNLRIIKGTALYTASFTPPTEKLIGVDGTTLLCCQDSDDPTQEATGKSITGYGKLAAGQPIQPKVLPSVGVDEGVVFDGDTKVNSQGYMYFPTGDTASRSKINNNFGARGVIGGGETVDHIMYNTIASTGNAIDFGNLVQNTDWPGAVGSRTRGVFGGGRDPANLNIIQYITIASAGNATDFGDMTVARREITGVGDETRGCYGGGLTGSSNVIDYITIATTGNAADFGDLTLTLDGAAGFQSPTRGVFAGGEGASPYPALNIIQYITIQSTGNAQDFGDLTVSKWAVYGCSSPTRGLTGGNGNVVSYVTIASSGNAIDFGDLTGTGHSGASFSSHIRGVFAIGGATNAMEYVTIATQGNGIDFGDTTWNSYRASGLSNGHGGLF